MKKKFIIVCVFILINTLQTYAQNKGVGINNTNPQADLDITGTLRLEHYTQGDGKILVANKDGDVRWTAPFSLKFLPGYMPPTGINLSGNAPKYTSAYITLPPGGYLFKTIILLNNLGGDLQINQGTFVTVYISDSPTDSSYSVDYMPGSAKEISGSLVGPSTYGLIDGNVVIRNTGTTSKTYYVWGKKEDFYDDTTSPTPRTVNISNLASTAWGENIIYAIPIE